jgi:hypothetical protein
MGRTLQIEAARARPIGGTMRIQILLPSIALALLLTSPAGAQESRLANYFSCTLTEGKTRADLMAFKVEYEKAVDEAGLEGYELRVQFPLYADDIGDGRFIWDGSWGDFEDMAEISAWFQASEWPARFQKLMSCESSSLWRVVD